MAEPQVFTELDVKAASGKKGLVLFFYPTAKGDASTTEVKEFNDHLDEFKVMGYNVVGVTTAKVKDNRKFAQSIKVKFPLISDLDKSITDGTYNNLDSAKTGFLGMGAKQAMRTTFILDNNGKILVTLRDVNPEDAGRQALDEIDKITRANKDEEAAITKGVDKAAAKAKKHESK